MPTLLQINVSANRGSTGRIAEDIGKVAQEKGWRSILAYGWSRNPSNNETIRIGSFYNVYEHALETRLFDNNGLASRLATRNFIKQIEIIKPDIIHLHNIHGYYLNYFKLFTFLNNTKIPVVWTFHDCWAFTGHCAHFESAGCEKWKSGCFKCPLKNAYPSSYVDRSRENYLLKRGLFTENVNLHIVPVCDWMSNFVKHSFLEKKHITVIHNGVDLNVFKPIASNNHGKHVVLGVSAVWTREKGLFDFYKLREILDKEKFKIILVGLNEKQMKELPIGILGINRTESIAELARLYALSDVLVNPTYEDTFPTVNIEALACGTPVVTYKTGGCPESVDEKTGVVVDQGDVNSLADAIVDVCSKDRSAYRVSCRLRAEKEYDRNMMINKYLGLYNTLLR